MKLLIGVFFFASTMAAAQVKVCTGADGKKVYTDYECEKIGLTRADVIQDINITPKQCPAIRDAIRNSQNAISRHDASLANTLTPGNNILRGALVNQLEANQLRYHRECER